MSDTCTIAAKLLEADADELRRCHNIDQLRPTWEDEPEAQAAHDEALAIAGQLRNVSNYILVMERQLAAEKERADYAWRNTNTIEKARQEEMAKRDELLAALEECLAAYSASPKRPPELVDDWEKCLARIDKANRQARAAIAKVKP